MVQTGGPCFNRRPSLLRIAREIEGEMELFDEAAQQKTKTGEPN